MTKTKRAVWWIKRDIRLADNTALFKAIQNADEVLPLFVFEPGLIQQPDCSPMHVWAWISALSDLKTNAKKRGGDIMVATGHITDVFEKLHAAWPFDTVYAHEETGNDWTFQRDKQVAKWCLKHSIQFKEHPQNGVIRALKPSDNRQKIIGERLFTTPPLPAPDTLKFPQSFAAKAAKNFIPSLGSFFDLEQHPMIQWEALQTVSESAAYYDLATWLDERGLGYSGGISSPNTAFIHGSRMSPHLAWGTISLRVLFAAIRGKRGALTDMTGSRAQQWRRSLRAMESRLHWHDHFIQRLESVPSTEFKALNPAYQDVHYADEPELLRAWCEGQTGFPIIDACMRCLSATGFINFRMRAMVVSFACFGLHLSWKTIHPHLACVFLDYEPGIHLSQLQMQAGIVGINTIRVYSPTKQIIDQDPDCRFIKRWIPELRSFTPAEIQSYERVYLGNYPKPIIDFKIRTKAMKDQIFAIRKSEMGRAESQKVLDKHGSKRRRRRSPKRNQNTRQGELF